MCKLVGMIGEIPQYEFCDEYKKAAAKEDLWRERLAQAEHEYAMASAAKQKMIQEHCPLDVGDVVDGIRIKNTNGTKEEPCFKCPDSKTERCNPRQCLLINPQLLRARAVKCRVNCRVWVNPTECPSYPACGKCHENVENHGGES